MSDAEIGAMVRRALDGDGVLATLHLRRGYDEGGGPFTVQVHVYEEHADPRRPEMGSVRGGHHQTTHGHTLGEALTRLDPPPKGAP